MANTVSLSYYGMGAFESTSSPDYVMVVVTRDWGNTDTITVDYATVDGDAEAGNDYSAKSGTLTFVYNQSISQMVTLPFVNDSIEEGTEKFKFTISNATNATIVQSQVNITITDDDYSTGGPVDDPDCHDIYDTAYAGVPGVEIATGNMYVSVPLDKIPDDT